MAKCRKTKNSCKVCLNPVCKKTGFQCQGKCAEWVHFKCMQPCSPGRLRDIKAGRLKVYCPCPDCTAKNIVKEYYVDASYTCQKPNCPARRGPICGNVECISAPKTVVACGKRSSDPSLACQDTIGEPRGYSSQGNDSDRLDHLTKTIGQLTHQVNCLMTKLITFNENNDVVDDEYETELYGEPQSTARHNLESDDDPEAKCKAKCNFFCNYAKKLFPSNGN